MRILSLAFFMFIAAFAANPAAAHDITKGDLVISAPWSRATPAGASVAAGYLAVTNKGLSADRLLSFTTDLAGQPEVHEMSNEGGIMKMRPLAKGLAIPAGATVKLEPGGYHLMFIGLKRMLKQGESFAGTLTFEKAGTVEVSFTVAPIGARGGHGGHN